MRLSRSIARAAQLGFTLIELIIVIVIIGILAAVAIPKYLDVSNDAKVAAAKGAAGAVASAAASNFALRQTTPPSVNSRVVTACADAGSLATLPDGLAIGGTGSTSTMGGTFSCVADYTGTSLGTLAPTFTVIGAT